MKKQANCIFMVVCRHLRMNTGFHAFFVGMKNLYYHLSMNARLILSFIHECNINAILLQIGHSINEHDFLFGIVLENFGHKFII